MSVNLGLTVPSMKRLYACDSQKIHNRGAQRSVTRSLHESLVSDSFVYNYKSTMRGPPSEKETKKNRQRESRGEFDDIDADRGVIYYCELSFSKETHVTLLSAMLPLSLFFFSLLGRRSSHCALVILHESSLYE